MRHQLDALAFPVAAELVEQAANGIGAELVGEQAAHLAQRQRLRGTDQRGLEDALGILGVHERKCALNQAKSGNPSGPGRSQRSSGEADGVCPGVSLGLSSLPAGRVRGG